ncbi:hypothetical protein [uncultured Draconibacterium sp.]|uniref:hypothetical protein n=1 Tax=uncultured Draconibacterium sp. TaxID=1573823 RepID=UPI0029C939C7|nr:hypothetical protein [uncultured Draconibacterium sp.]
MKKLVLLVILFTSLCIISCNSSKNSDEIASYTYQEKKVEMSDSLRVKIPDWVEEGKICFGLVVQVTKEGKPITGKPVKAKVVQIDENSVKMKALETVILYEGPDRNLKGINKGQVWDEKEGDLYLTFEEAVEVLEKMEIYKSE